MDKTLIGILLMSGSALFYGLANPFLKKAGFNPFATIFVQVSFLWLSILPFFLWTKSYQHLLENKSGLMTLIILGVGNAVGYYLVVRAFEFLPQWQISLFALLSPFLTSLAAYVVLGETVTAKFFLGMAFMAIGMYVAFH